MPNAQHEVTQELSAEEIATRLAALQAGTLAPEPPHPPDVVRKVAAGSRFYAPLEDAADEYIRFAQTRSERVYLGIREFDEAMRGIAPGEMLVVQGYAHSGKTVLVTEMLLNNRDRRVAFFTPDETRVLVLIKLASLSHGVSAEELENRIAQDDQDAIEMVRSTARELFPNLAVFDEGLTLQQMDHALDEVEAHWGGKVELVIYDYVKLLQGAGEDIPTRFNALKAWGKRPERRFPLVALHQSSRSNGRDGAKVKIDSGEYGGEQQATHMIGVRRKKYELLARIEELQEKIATAVNVNPVHEDKLYEAQADLARHEHTITFNLVKNKRPPSRLVDDVDFELDWETGRVRRLDARPVDRSLVDRRITAQSPMARARGVIEGQQTWGPDDEF